LLPLLTSFCADTGPSGCFFLLSLLFFRCALAARLRLRAPPESCPQLFTSLKLDPPCPVLDRLRLFWHQATFAPFLFLRLLFFVRSSFSDRPDLRIFAVCPFFWFFFLAAWTTLWVLFNFGKSVPVFNLLPLPGRIRQFPLLKRRHGLLSVFFCLGFYLSLSPPFLGPLRFFSLQPNELRRF